MRERFIIVVLFMGLILAGCGNHVSKEEYDKIVAERDELEAEIENIKRNDWYEIGKSKLEEQAEIVKINMTEDYNNVILYIQNNISDNEKDEYISYVNDIYSHNIESIDYAVKDYIKIGEELRDTMDEDKIVENNIDTLLYSSRLLSTVEVGFTIRVRELLPNYDESYNGFK